MAGFSYTGTLAIPRIYQRIYVSGALRPDVFCADFQQQPGTAGATAGLIVPGERWDSRKWWWRGKYVRVDVEFEGVTRTIFCGFIREAEGQATGQGVRIEAVSLIAMTNKVYIGQGDSGDSDFAADYPERAKNDSGQWQATGWTVAKILRDWFGASTRTWRGGGGSLPSAWRNRIKLGDMTALSREWNLFPIGDQTFRRVALSDGIDRLLALMGTVSFYERFAGDEARLEFFEVGDPWAPERAIRVVEEGESAAGTHVADVTHTENTGDVVNRMIGFGASRKYVVSVTDDPAAPAAARLRHGWDATLEAAVLANPESSKRGNESGGSDGGRQEFSEARAHVFRRYLLPECFRNVILEKQNAARTVDAVTGEENNLPIQVWRNTTTKTVDPETGTITGVWSGTPKLLEGTQFDLENLTFTLKEPAIDLVSSTLDGAGKPVDTWGEAVVGITLTYNGARLRWDTGKNGAEIGYEELGEAGLCEAVENDSFTFVQIGNQGTGLNGVEFGSTWLLLGNTWQVYATATEIENMEEDLRYFAEAALRENNRAQTYYDIQTPYFCDAFRLGDKIRVVGQGDYERGSHQIMTLRHEFGEGHRSQYSTDSNSPKIGNQVFKGDL